MSLSNLEANHPQGLVLFQARFDEATLAHLAPVAKARELAQALDELFDAGGKKSFQAPLWSGSFEFRDLTSSKLAFEAGSAYVDSLRGSMNWDWEMDPVDPQSRAKLMDALGAGVVGVALVKVQSARLGGAASRLALAEMMSEYEGRASAVGTQTEARMEAAGFGLASGLEHARAASESLALGAASGTAPKKNKRAL